MTGRASRTKAWAAFLVAWTGISCAAALYLESGDPRILVPLLAGMVAASALWHPIARAGVVVAVLGAASFAAIRYVVEGVDGLAQPALVTAVALVGVGLLADALAARVEEEARRRRHDALLIEELTPTSATGAMKWQHAEKQLADEVGRGRRYKYPVSLVLVGLPPALENADDAASQAAVRQRSELVKILISKTRTSDKVSFHGNDQIALVLPHTPLKGALAFLDKNIVEIKETTGLDTSMGVAEFPTDAGSPEELVREAEAALEFGRASGVRIVSRSLLMGAQEPTPAGEVPPPGA